MGIKKRLVQFSQRLWKNVLMKLTSPRTFYPTPKPGLVWSWLPLPAISGLHLFYPLLYLSSASMTTPLVLNKKRMLSGQQSKQVVQVLKVQQQSENIVAHNNLSSWQL